MNRFPKADDVLNSLIATTLSCVDFYRPTYFLLGMWFLSYQTPNLHSWLYRKCTRNGGLQAWRSASYQSSYGWRNKDGCGQIYFTCVNRYGLSGEVLFYFVCLGIDLWCYHRLGSVFNKLECTVYHNLEGDSSFGEFCEDIRFLISHNLPILFLSLDHSL